MTRACVPPWALPGLSVLYAGMILGVSFIAVPAKFLAESIDLAQALDVGRQTFRVFGWVELVCGFGLLLLSIISRRRGLGWLSLLVLVAVGAQILLIRPVLDRRVDLIMQAVEVGSSNLHNVYGALELGKVIVLLTIAWIARPKKDPGICNRRSASDSVVAGDQYP